jgi:probable phosphoglycerate mutase
MNTGSGTGGNSRCGTRILLVRHGHVDWIEPERFRGRAPLLLSPLGRRQAMAVAARITAVTKPSAIYTSPLERCAETARAIGAACGVVAQPLEALTDIDYGPWQGLTHDEVRARWPAALELWLAAPQLATPGGESLAAVHARVAAAVVDVATRHRGQTIVVVTHDSVIRVLLLMALDLPLSRYWRFAPPPCSMTDLSVAGGEFFVHSFNETCHLHDVRTPGSKP